MEAKTIESDHSKTDIKKVVGNWKISIGLVSFWIKAKTRVHNNGEVEKGKFKVVTVKVDNILVDENERSYRLDKSIIFVVYIMMDW